MPNLRPSTLFLLSFLTVMAPHAFAGLPRPLPVPGGIVWIDLPPALPAGSTIRFEDREVLRLARQGRQQALVGLPLDLAPGTHALTWVRPDGSVQSLPFMVREKRYPTQHVRIADHGKVELSPENEARVASEHAEIRRLKLTRSEVELSAADLDFAAPAKGPRSGRFGARRVFNGQPRAPHVGLDFAVPRGAPVTSAAAGRVLAVSDYFFNGKSVFVDHGQGLITLYCHLDQIDVVPGQSLRRGEAIGRAGSTGRASGPHLHWSVVLNGTMVDPERFLAGR